MQDCWESYGVDWRGPVPIGGDHTVIVPELVEELTDSLLAQTVQQYLRGSEGASNIARYFIAREVARSLLN